MFPKQQGLLTSTVCGFVVVRMIFCSDVTFVVWMVYFEFCDFIYCVAIFAAKLTYQMSPCCANELTTNVQPDP